MNHIGNVFVASRIRMRDCYRLRDSMGQGDLVNLQARRELHPLRALPPTRALRPHPHVARKHWPQLPENLLSVLQRHRPLRQALFRRIEEAWGITL